MDPGDLCDCSGLTNTKDERGCFVRNIPECSHAFETPMKLWYFWASTVLLFPLSSASPPNPTLTLTPTLPSTLASAALCKCTKYCISHTSSDLTSILQLTYLRIQMAFAFKKR